MQAYGRDVAWIGEGGTIPFMNMLAGTLPARAVFHYRSARTALECARAERVFVCAVREKADGGGSQRCRRSPLGNSDCAPTLDRLLQKRIDRRCLDCVESEMMRSALQFLDRVFGIERCRTGLFR